MAALDWWHPVLPSAALGDAPRAVALLGHEAVLFRAGGTLGALCDRCPHRGMRLSRGWVEQDRLVCPYHGWSYDAAGRGESPGTPKLHVEAPRFDVVERHGAIWLRGAAASGPAAAPAPAPPALDFPGYHPVCVLSHDFEAPLELVLDNFCEVEHTPTTHAYLGYAREALAAVETRVEVTAESVRVTNRGPQKPIPAPLAWLVGIRAGDAFTDDWTTFFAPVHTIYDQLWTDPRTGAERANRLKVAVFFTPLDAERTRLITFVFTTLAPSGRLGLDGLLRPLLVRLVDHEVRLDKAMVEGLADKRPELPGARLGRFDKALYENRRRLATIYRGLPEPPAAACGEAPR